jgi:hypothetical protein
MGLDKSLSRNDRHRIISLVLLGALVMAVLAVKSYQEGWFERRMPLPLNGKPALILFILERGCECQMSVVWNAEAQIAGWDAPDELGLPVLQVDYNRRLDLAQKYGVARAPALVLLDSQGQVVWKQDVGISDKAPLDLVAAELHIHQLREAQP